MSPQRRAPGLPEQIGNYLVLDRIAQGGVAEVFRARKPDGPIVGVKRIPAAVIDEDVDFVLRFEAEVQVAERLRHPNIVEVFEHGEDGGYFLAMEYVDGPDLHTLLRRVDTLEPPLVAYIGCEMARALHYLHRSDPSTGRGPLIHFDVSAQNILLGRNGAVKLSDFGLARALKKTGAETITATRGQAHYLSPEQWNNEVVGARSDLFALGLVLWYALIGTHPYAEGRPKGTDLNDWICARTIANERRSVEVAAANAPPALQQAIHGLLQPSAVRIPTAETVFHLLSPFVPVDAPARLAAQVAS